MPHRKGSELSAAEQKYVLSAFVHRFTREHVPAWSRKPRPDGTAYPVQFASDADWLEHTQFVVNSKGLVDRNVEHCYSIPTWPDGNPEPKPQLTTYGYLDCSTSHIAAEDNEQLGHDAMRTDSPLIIYKTDHGFWVMVPPTGARGHVKHMRQDLKSRGYSKAFVELLLTAGRASCYWIKFDSDGLLHESLPTFDW